MLYDEINNLERKLMKECIRGIRRHHLQRLKKARAADYGMGEGQQGDLAVLGRHVNTPAKCSCWMCGNPRRFFGEKSLQERIQDEKFTAEGAVIGSVRFD